MKSGKSPNGIGYTLKKESKAFVIYQWMGDCMVPLSILRFNHFKENAVLVAFQQLLQTGKLDSKFFAV